MIINSTKCRPRKAVKEAIENFLDCYVIPRPKILKTSENAITYFWEDFLGEKCYLKVVMENISASIVISNKNNFYPESPLSVYSCLSLDVFNSLGVWHDYKIKEAWCKI